MARLTGRSPRRYSTVKVDGVPDRQVPHCAGCDVIMDDLKIPMLNYWQPAFQHTRKFPFAEPIFFCSGCRYDHDLHHDAYVLVPMGPDQNLREALEAMLEAMPD